MTLEQRVDRLEASWGKNDEAVRDLRDAVTVTAHLENRQGKLLKEHSEWLANHELDIKEHKAAMKEHDVAMKRLDERIEKLVVAIGELIRKP